MCIHTYGCSTFRGQERTLDIPELEILVFVNHVMWVLYIIWPHNSKPFNSEGAAFSIKIIHSVGSIIHSTLSYVTKKVECF